MPAPERGLAIDKPVHPVAVMLPRIFECFAVMVLYALAAGPAHAQDWPANPITLVMGFPADSGLDVVAR